MTRNQAATAYRNLLSQFEGSAYSFKRACYMLLSDHGEMFADGEPPGFKGFTPADWVAAGEGVLDQEKRDANRERARARRARDRG